jgi:hypothetical protein
MTNEELYTIKKLKFIKKCLYFCFSFKFSINIGAASCQYFNIYGGNYKSMYKKQDKKVTFEKQKEWIVVAVVSNHNSFQIISSGQTTVKIFFCQFQF